MYESGADSGFKDADPGNGYVLTCTKFDSKAFAEFRDDAPEQVGRALRERQGHGARHLSPGLSFRRRGGETGHTRLT